MRAGVTTPTSEWSSGFVAGLKYWIGFGWVRSLFGSSSKGSAGRSSTAKPTYDFSTPGASRAVGGPRARMACAWGVDCACASVPVRMLSPPRHHAHADRAPRPASSARCAEAEALREKHRVASDAVRDLETQIRDVEGKMTADYGPDGRFERVSRECFEFKVGGEWDYEMCPYKDAKQKSATGGGSTGIGNWEGFGKAADGSTDYQVMMFTNGQMCWNGPMRSLTVTLLCAAENKILNVEEPEVCKYTMRFETPLACMEEHAAAARQEVELLRVPNHDEL